MLDILLSASAEVVHYQMRQLLSTEGCAGKYVRLEPELGNASVEMDDASEGNIRDLREAGSGFVFANVERLEGVTDFLFEDLKIAEAISYVLEFVRSRKQPDDE